MGKSVTLEPVVLKGVSKAAPAITHTASKSIAQGALNSLLKTPLNEITSTRLPDELREVPAPKPGFWQSFNNFSNLTNNIPGQILFGIANDAYIFGKSYSQGHRGPIKDLNNEYVGSKERLSAGISTFQLSMLFTNFAMAGRTVTANGVRNSHLAGKVHPKTGVPFDKTGFPNFSNNLYKGGMNDVMIKPTGNRVADFAAANKSGGYSSTPKGYTWHHHQYTGRMQLVETGAHSQTGHTGGFSLWKY